MILSCEGHFDFTRLHITTTSYCASKEVNHRDIDMI